MRTDLPGTLIDALRRSASDHPRSGISVLDRRARLIERRTLPAFLEAAQMAATRLSRAGVRGQTPVVVALPTSWSWLEAWFGTLLAGGLPVAISPASPLGSAEEDLRRMSALLERLGGRHVVCTPNLRRALAEAPSMPSDLTALTPEEMAALDPAPSLDSPAADPESVAFLQLTSGTTGESRVVMISHRAAVHNAEVIGRALAAPVGVSLSEAPNWDVVSWLPLYHDMGLVGSLLAGVIHGVEVRLMPPQAFLGRPLSWLQVLGSGTSSVTTAPNFGYQFCVEQTAPSQLEGLDLSSWRAALVGAEMVRPETLETFADRFGPNGFRRESFRPCYGLAEAALAVTIDQMGSGCRTQPVPAGAMSDAVAHAACLGAPVEDTEVWATTPTGERLAEGDIGEIRVRGPGVFEGYLNDPAATADSLAGDWLCTGDLGFISGGELYLTGRIKEILVVRGQNIMPHDIERIAEAELGGGGVCRAASFTVDRGAQGEQIVVVAEAPTKVLESLRELEATIHREVGLALGLPIADLAFVAAGKLPRTTSGKVPRQRLRDDYLAGRIARVEL